MDATPPRPEHLASMLEVRSVAAMLRCSTRHVYRLADAGLMPPPVKLGALTRWSKPVIDAWIAGGCAAPDQGPRS